MTKTRSNDTRLRRSIHAILAGCALVTTLFAHGPAQAEIRREGTWPEKEAPVTLSLTATPRNEAVRKVAAAAGWSLLFKAPPGDPVDLQVTDQPASKVIDLLLADGVYRARRDGDLVALEKIDETTTNAPAAAPTVDPAAAKAARVAKKRGSDRSVIGGSERIESTDTVRDLMVLGGSAEILGTVTGDVLVVGGRARLREGSHVLGDVAAVGGSVSLDDGSRVDGDLMRLGGSMDRAPGAIVSGEVSDSKVHVDFENGKFHAEVTDDPPATPLRRALDVVGSSITSAAMLFVFGVILLALAARRMETLKLEVARRPMHALAVGALGAVGSLVLFIALCVTVVGIPIALIGLLIGVVGVYAGICAALTMTGELLLRHRTQNPYVHLALGCAILMVLSALPFVGAFVKVAAALIGLGVLFATRGAGFWPARRTLPNPS